MFSLLSFQIKPLHLEKPKIYDCFLFYNELDLLELRFHELYDHVDYFVIVEAVETFRGNPKKLYFEENRNFFEPFLDKIIHVVIEDRFITENPWEREAFQRNQIMRGLKNCNTNDIILISDVDEIIRASVLTEVRNRLYTEPERAIGFIQPMYRYFINCLDAECWFGTIATYYLHLQKYCPEHFRQQRWFYPPIQNAGWHFTWMGGPERIVQKVISFSHSESDIPETRDPKNWEAGIHSYGQLVEIDETFP